jgi:hypothetical protein
MDLMPHERPTTLLLARGADLGQALATALRHPDVRAFALPAPWFLDDAHVDLVAALPTVRTLTPETLPEVIATARRLCTPADLNAHAKRLWREVDERVRQHYLKTGALKTFAAIFGLGRKSKDDAPHPEFVREQAFTHRLECQYRLAPVPMERPTPAPPEEGSLVVYPFDPDGRLARGAHDPDVGGVIECFAYVWQQERHEAFWKQVAETLGARLVGA